MNTASTHTAGSVLVVDDEPINLAVVEGLLAPLGFEVRTAADGAAALAEVRRDAPDVVLLDVMMPGMSGFEVCERLRSDASTALVPVVMVTALDAHEHRLRGLRAGADEFLTKPFDEVELEVRVRSLVARSHLQRRLHTSEQVVASLATVIEVKDDVTGGHCTRLQRNAERFADALLLDPTARETLSWAGLLHDVGKVGVPDHVLNKPGRLDDDEWEVMRGHTELGERIVRPLGGLVDVVPIVRHHHERFDGSGYPDGLRGEEIPFLARVFQCLDIYDALTSARPYKRALTADEALEVMDGEAGTIIDPDLFDLFATKVAPGCETEVVR